MRGSKQTPSATLIGLSESAQLSQAQGLPVECSPAALRHSQCAVTVLHPLLILFLNKRGNQRDFNQRMSST